MTLNFWRLVFSTLVAMILVLGSAASRADGDDRHDHDRGRCFAPVISFISFQSPNLAATGPADASLTIKGKMSVPRCVGRREKLPAVVILHGSSGVDARGDFYEAALNDAGIATLQIDMWEARGVTGIANRPQAPILTYPDAFSALAFLASQPGIAADRIGVIGFSWGGVVSLAASERLYAGWFGGGRTFKAHVANYPVCWGANRTDIPALYPPAEKGTQYLNLTGAKVLIQIGSEDDYDNGTGPCTALAAFVNPSNDNVVTVAPYAGAYHAWDRLMIPVTAPDPFADEGSYFRTGRLPIVRIEPDVRQANEARARALGFFLRNL